MDDIHFTKNLLARRKTNTSTQNVHEMVWFCFQCDPALLPEPNHVMLNHLYALSIKVSIQANSNISGQRS